MASVTVKILTCDRCEFVEEIRHAHREYAWGRIAYHEVNGPRWVATGPGAGGKLTDRSDLCPHCLRELHAWWENGQPKEQDDEQ